MKRISVILAMVLFRGTALGLQSPPMEESSRAAAREPDALPPAGADRGSTVKGVVTDAAAHPLEGATVRLSFRDGDRERESVTDSHGAFLFENVPPGRWRLQIVSGSA